MKTVRKPMSRERLVTVVQGESKTDTSFGNETNINKIIARFTRTGILPSSERVPQYADVTGLQKDLTTLVNEGKEASERVKAAQTQKTKDEREKQIAEQNQLRERVKQLESQLQTTSSPDQT